MKKFFLIALVLLAAMGAICAVADTTIVDSGTCGTNVAWQLDSDGLLTISGTGEMNSYSCEPYSSKYITTAPWGTYYLVIKNVTIESNVTNISEHAFYGCSNLTSVTIPEDVTSIGDSAFCNCSSLTCITIPEGVTSIRYETFYGCDALTSVKIPEGVTVIGKRAFFACKSLTSITFPESVTSISFEAFAECSNLTSITYPEGLTSIGSGAFCDCSSLTSINIPDNVEFISDNVFAGCNNLTSIGIPDGVKGIGAWAFYSCSSLTSISIPNGVKSIGSDAFAGCSSLTSINIPESVTSIGDYAFQGCSGLTGVNIQKGVTTIGNYTFKGCSGLTSINLPASVTKIGNNAFCNCNNLASIYIPESLTSIGTSVFENCPAKRYCKFNGVAAKILSNEQYTYNVVGYEKLYFEYTSVTDCEADAVTVIIPDGVTEIGNWAFSNCYNLVTINLPKSLKTIGYYSFADCRSLTNIVIQEFVTSIGTSAFSHCSSLVSINLPSSITTIGSNPFKSCEKLENITVAPDSVYLSVIDGVLFGESGKTLVTYPCTKSNSGYIIPEGVTSIGGDAFYDCVSLVNITIPESVTNIESYAFYNCNNLVTINIPESMTSIGNYAFCNCSSLVSINIPENVTSINGGVFFACSCLTNIKISEGVTRIGYNAFYSCSSLTNIAIPDSVTCIDDYAFRSCINLVSIKLSTNYPRLKNDTYSIIHDCPNLKCVIIPMGVSSLSTSYFPSSFKGSFYCYRYSYVAQWILDNYGSSRLKYIDDCSEDYADGLYLPEKMYIELGKTKTVPVGTWPEQTYTFNWSSSNSSIVSITPNGLITGNAVGISTIQVQNGSKKTSCQVECYIPAESLSIESEKWIDATDSFTIDAVLIPSNASEGVTFKVTDTLIATVDANGLVTPKAVGTTTIIATTTATGINATMSLHVTYPAQSVSFEEETVTAEIGVERQLTANVQNSVGTLVNKMVTFTSSNDAIASVSSNGIVTGHAVGTVTITAKTSNGKTATCTVNVIDHVHIPLDFDAKAVTCTEDGYNAGTRCTVCDEILSGGEVIPATGHTRVIDAQPVLPTRSAAGTMAVIHCSVCEEVLSNGETIASLSDGDISTLPASLKKIASEAYASISVRCVIIPSGCTTIGSRAFANCASLVVIQIPASVTSIATDTFDGCGDLTIVTPAGSTAAAYAEAHGIPWTDNWEA